MFSRQHPVPQELAAALARAAPRLGHFGSDVLWYPETSSTNDVAASLVERGAAEGVIVIAETQTAGRGRLGRVWCSPPGAGLYVSIVLRPEPQTIPLVTIAAGVALAEGIRTATGIVPNLKWPNDVYVNGRKLAGILAERMSGGAALQACVVGFGINVRAAAYPADIGARATSLEGELGRTVDAGELLAACIASFATQYDDLQRNRAAAVLDAWRVFARPLLGRTVEWEGHGGVRRGTAEDIDATGALVVRTPQGTTRVISGEVRWI